MYTQKEELEYLNEIEFVRENNYVEKSSYENDSIENIDIRKCKFATYGGDFLVRQLVDMMSEEEIEIPKIQRNYDRLHGKGQIESFYKIRVQRSMVQ